MWRSGASEAIGRFLPPSCKNLQRACRPQTVIKLPKKKYTPKQDVQLGKEAASEVRKQYPIIEDQHIAKYLTQIGNRLVAAAPTELKQSVYEYSFTPVNLKDINAFALPGGPMFVQRGMFDQFGSTRPQPGSKWRCSGPPSFARQLRRATASQPPLPVLAAQRDARAVQ